VCPPAGRAHVQPGWLPWGPETAAIRTEPIRVVGSVNQGLAKPTARKGADSGHHFPRLLQYITGLEGCISWVGSSVRYLQVCGPWGTGGAARRVPGCSDVRCCPPQVSWTAAQLDEPAAAGGLTGRLPPCSLAHCPLAPTSDTQMSCTSGGKRDACRHIRRGLSNGFVQILNPSPPGTACPSPRPQYEYYILPHYATIASTRPPAPLAPIHRLTRVRASGLPRRCQDCSPSLAPQSLPVAVSSPWAA
jgi:hypothetical protein